jgi:hypothetical protein
MRYAGAPRNPPGRTRQELAMNFREFASVSALCVLLGGLSAQYAVAANQPPLSEAWNIRPSGSAASSGELLFRVTPPGGADPVEITVSVLAGSSDVAVARTIRRTLDAQLRSVSVTLGEGANVLVTDPRGRANFSVELVTSDVENLRVAVSATAPIAPPTVPPQEIPATTQAPPTPPAPGGAVPPSGTSVPIPQPSTPIPQPSIPTPKPSTPLPEGSIKPPNTGAPPPINETRPPRREKSEPVEAPQPEPTEQGRE